MARAIPRHPLNEALTEIDENRLFVDKPNASRDNGMELEYM